jgi:phage shock protein A
MDPELGALAAEAGTRIKWLELQLAEAKRKIEELETELKRVKAKIPN